VALPLARRFAIEHGLVLAAFRGEQGVTRWGTVIMSCVARASSIHGVVVVGPSEPPRRTFWGKGG
jgi:hypothetical protein